MKKFITVLVLTMFFVSYLELFAQTTSTRTSTSSSGRTGTSIRGTSGTSGTYYDTASTEFVVATVMNMLRHPNKEIRMQALQSLVGGMTLGTTTTGSTSTSTGIGDIFGMRGTRSTSSSSTSSTYGGGLGSTAAIPEFFTMLADPDPEIRDLVSIALDQIFGTDASLLRFMNDPDPVVRRYAIRLFVIRAQEGDQYRGTRTTSSSGTTYGRSANDILIMRILLNMMKDPDPDVKKVAEDALEKFISSLEQIYQQTTTTGQPQTQGNIPMR